MTQNLPGLAYGPADHPADPAVDLLVNFGWLGRALFHQHALREVGGSGQGPAPRHLITLAVLAQTGTVTVGQLAERLHVSLATASLLVADLARFGLVERTDDPSDRRRTLVRVTGGGPGTGADLLESVLAPVRRALERLRPGSRRDLLGAFQALRRELEGCGEPQ